MNEMMTKLMEEIAAKPFLIKSSIRTPDGTVLVSRGRHDCVGHTDTVNGKFYMLDGGCDYQRMTTAEPYEDLSVWSDAPFEVIREIFEWGTYGKNGDQPLQWKRLCDLTDNHIEAIIRTQFQLPNERLDLFKKELEYRKLNGIEVDE